MKLASMRTQHQRRDGPEVEGAVQRTPEYPGLRTPASVTCRIGACRGGRYARPRTPELATRRAGAGPCHFVLTP